VTLSRAELPPLYALTDTSSRARRQEEIQELITAGVRWIQIREKAIDDLDFYEIVRAAVASLPAKVRLIVNDRLDIALACTADGVHLGDRDLPVDAARQVAGPLPLVIGLSTHSLEEALVASENPSVDYVAIGPIFSSPTKTVRSPLGVAVIAELRRATEKPVVAIGGIDAGNIATVLKAGADSAAVLSALYRGGSIARNVRALLDASGELA
jgi:thiamine-phosphate pyrophosphorylase